MLLYEISEKNPLLHQTPSCVSYGVGAKQRATHEPAARTQAPPPIVRRHEQRSGGNAATAAQVPPVATAFTQNPAAILTQAPQAIKPLSA